ncbi:hypothetical protein [Sheuella amnicola]|nr:hypothetical protein [Sheuella amnicola]
MKKTHSTTRYRSYFFRAVAIVCMLYGVSLIADTAAAATLSRLI